MDYYYIPNLDDVLKGSKKKLPSRIKGKNIIHIITERDKQFLIKLIEAKEYATDEELIASLKTHFPDIEKKMSSGNISVSELRT